MRLVLSPYMILPVWVLLYAAFALVAGDTDPHQWNVGARAGLAFLILVVGLVIIGAVFGDDER